LRSRREAEDRDEDHRRQQRKHGERRVRRDAARIADNGALQTEADAQAERGTHDRNPHSQTHGQQSAATERSPKKIASAQARSKSHTPSPARAAANIDSNVYHN
jgi:hypothetical protein